LSLPWVRSSFFSIAACWTPHRHCFFACAGPFLAH
jgi:hypothetical protein